MKRRHNFMKKRRNVKLKNANKVTRSQKNIDTNVACLKRRNTGTRLTAL